MFNMKASQFSKQLGKLVAGVASYHSYYYPLTSLSLAQGAEINS
ncbi:MAG: hypothetical protein Q7S76_01695 [bacterium]|nr:hypothetical protein [bacterium]